MRIAAYLLAALNLVLWGVLSVVGAAYIWTISRQGAHAYPNAAQIVLWLIIPVVISALSLGRPILRLRAGERNLGIGTLIATLLLLPFYAPIFAAGA